MSGRDWRLDFVLMMGFGTGLYSFLKGFRIYREYRILEDTPEAPVRAIAMGLVHVRGRAAGAERLTSPLTRTPSTSTRLTLRSGNATKIAAGGGTTPRTSGDFGSMWKIQRARFWST